MDLSADPQQRMTTGVNLGGENAEKGNCPAGLFGDVCEGEKRKPSNGEPGSHSLGGAKTQSRRLRPHAQDMPNASWGRGVYDSERGVFKRILPWPRDEFCESVPEKSDRGIVEFQKELK